jgi:DNA polymerase-3 subunit delta'
VDPRALHALGDRLAGTETAPLAAFIDTVNGWLSDRLAAGSRDGARLDRLARAWENVNSASRDAQTYNLDRKPLVFSVFGWLAEAARG